MAMKKKPQGKFAAGKVEAPRKVTINGETHYLVYVTPEEAKGLKKAGGTGQAGPKGIPAYPVGSVNKEKVDKAKAKPAPTIGIINGEISIAPIITAVEFTFKPTEAITIAQAKIHKLEPRKEMLDLIFSKTFSFCSSPV